MNRSVMTMLLSRLGHTLQAASSGSEALEKWEQGSFHVILMDVEMPGVDGTEATRRIREASGEGSDAPPS